MVSMNDEVVLSYNKYIGVLKSYIPIMIQNLRIVKEESIVIKDIIDLFEGIEWIVNVNIKLNEIYYQNTIDIQKINDILKDLTQAYEFKDYNLCADILEYEFLEEVHNFKNYKIDIRVGESNE